MDPMSFDDLSATPVSRRGILRAGGLTAAAAAILAACAHVATDAKPARVGDAAAPPKLPDAVITDGVLFRTSTSIHYSIIDSHTVSKKLGKLTGDQSAMLDAYIAANKVAIKELQKLSVTAGSEAWSCANPRFDRVVLTPLRDHMTGRPKEGTEENDIPPSDNVNRDAMALAHAMESLGAAMHQSLVPQYSKPSYRAAAMTQGQTAARRAAALALFIAPENVINPTAVENANLEDATLATVAETTTTVQNIAQNEGKATATTLPAISDPQMYYAVPSQFGTLSAVQLAIGAPSSGTQYTLNIETPSLNSFIYDYEAGSDCVAYS